ncbi:MAG: hypothetical protein ACRD3B_07795 [Candidatus Sulfotelmatobacter sp.]
MGSDDFLHVQAATPLCECYTVAGSSLSLATNHEVVLKAARSAFAQIANPSGSVDFRLRFWLDNADASTAPWPQPYVRGLNHLVFAGFGEKSSMLADLRRRRVTGRFSLAMGADVTHWRTIIFPVLLTILSGSMGLVELHASCVEKEGRGLVLLGASHSGKSTLAMALTRRGFRLLSDDRIFCALQKRRIAAYGLPRPLKLRHEAASWFDELRDREPTLSPDGKRVFYCEPDERDEERSARICEPQALIVLKQRPSPMFRMTPIGADEVRSMVEADLLVEAREAADAQQTVLDHLTMLPCWWLEYGGNPHSIAERIEAAVLRN